MNAELSATGLSLVVGAALIVIALRAWQKASATLARERLFAVRAALFDAALRDRAFGDAAYREAEARINGMLRWVEHVNGLYLCSVILRVRFGGLDVPARTSSEHSAIASAIATADAEISSAVRRHLWTGTMSGFLLMAVGWLTGQLGRIFGAADGYARRLSGDSFARREWSVWKHPTRPA